MMSVYLIKSAFGLQNSMKIGWIQFSKTTTNHSFIFKQVGTSIILIEWNRDQDVLDKEECLFLSLKTSQRVNQFTDLQK